MRLSCVILAAGLGTRMNSSQPKVLHEVCGVPMLYSVVQTARELKPERIVIVAGRQKELIEGSMECRGEVFALQKEPKGTGHALKCAVPFLKNFKGIVVVLNGDTPLLKPGTIKRFLALHEKGENAVSVLSFPAEDPNRYGRIIRDASGTFVSIVEHSDADPAQRKINEVNSGVYAINRAALSVLNRIRMNRAKGEYYLTDIVAAASKAGMRISAYCIGTEEEFMGVNTRGELLRASELMRRRIVMEWVERGVNFLDPDSVFIHPPVSIGKETVIYPNVCLEGHTRIGKNCTIYPNVRIRNCTVGNNVVIKDSTVMEDSRIRDRATVGPFARIRPGSEIGSDARIGNFVELKKAVIGRASKLSHLSYIGDAVVGKDVNIGAGTITCNYDGERKHPTVIEDGAFVGSDTQLVAPVRVGKGAYIGAGSTITEDVPPMSLAVSRARQRNIEGWASKRKSKVGSKKLRAGNQRDK